MGIIVVLGIIAGVYFIGLPMLNGSQRTTSTPPQDTTILTPETTGQPVAFSPKLTPEITALPAVSQTYEEKYMETYNQVYSDNRAFTGGQKATFTTDTTVPSLYIKFNITPKMYYDERPVEIGTHNEHIANVTYPSQNAWFKVVVYDADNGEMKADDGFNKEYSIMTPKEMMVRAPGHYRVELTGNDVTAEVRILTGKS